MNNKVQQCHSIPTSHIVQGVRESSPPNRSMVCRSVGRRTDQGEHHVVKICSTNHSSAPVAGVTSPQYYPNKRIAWCQWAWRCLMWFRVEWCSRKAGVETRSSLHSWRGKWWGFVKLLLWWHGMLQRLNSKTNWWIPLCNAVKEIGDPRNRYHRSHCAFNDRVRKVQEGAYECANRMLIRLLSTLLPIDEQ